MKKLLFIFTAIIIASCTQSGGVISIIEDQDSVLVDSVDTLILDSLNEVVIGK